MGLLTPRPRTTRELVNELRQLAERISELKMSTLDDNQEFDSSAHPAYRKLSGAEYGLREAIEYLTDTGLPLFAKEVCDE